MGIGISGPVHRPVSRRPSREDEVRRRGDRRVHESAGGHETGSRGGREEAAKREVVERERERAAEGRKEGERERERKGGEREIGRGEEEEEKPKEEVEEEKERRRIVTESAHSPPCTRHGPSVHPLRTRTGTPVPQLRGQLPPATAAAARAATQESATADVPAAAAASPSPAAATASAAGADLRERRVAVSHEDVLPQRLRERRADTEVLLGAVLQARRFRRHGVLLLRIRKEYTHIPIGILGMGGRALGSTRANIVTSACVWKCATIVSL